MKPHMPAYKVFHFRVTCVKVVPGEPGRPDQKVPGMRELIWYLSKDKDVCKQRLYGLAFRLFDPVETAKQIEPAEYNAASALEIKKWGPTADIAFEVPPDIRPRLDAIKKAGFKPSAVAREQLKILITMGADLLWERHPEVFYSHANRTLTEKREEASARRMADLRASFIAGHCGIDTEEVRELAIRNVTLAAKRIDLDDLDHLRGRGRPPGRTNKLDPEKTDPRRVGGRLGQSEGAQDVLRPRDRVTLPLSHHVSKTAWLAPTWMKNRVGGVGVREIENRIPIEDCRLLARLIAAHYLKTVKHFTMDQIYTLSDDVVALSLYSCDLADLMKTCEVWHINISGSPHHIREVIAGWLDPGLVKGYKEGERERQREAAEARDLQAIAAIKKAEDANIELFKKSVDEILGRTSELLAKEPDLLDKAIASPNNLTSTLDLNPLCLINPYAFRGQMPLDLGSRPRHPRSCSSNGYLLSTELADAEKIHLALQLDWSDMSAERFDAQLDRYGVRRPDTQEPDDAIQHFRSYHNEYHQTEPLKTHSTTLLRLRLWFGDMSTIHKDEIARSIVSHRSLAPNDPRLLKEFEAIAATSFLQTPHRFIQHRCIPPALKIRPDETLAYRNNWNGLWPDKRPGYADPDSNNRVMFPGKTPFSLLTRDPWARFLFAASIFASGWHRYPSSLDIMSPDVWVSERNDPAAYDPMSQIEAAPDISYHTLELECRYRDEWVGAMKRYAELGQDAVDRLSEPAANTSVVVEHPVEEDEPEESEPPIITAGGRILTLIPQEEEPLRSIKDVSAEQIRQLDYLMERSDEEIASTLTQLGIEPDIDGFKACFAAQMRALSEIGDPEWSEILDDLISPDAVESMSDADLVTFFRDGRLVDAGVEELRSEIQSRYALS